MRTLRSLLLAGVAMLALSACATTRSSVPGPDYSSMSQAQVEASLPQLSERYRAAPRDKAIIIHFSAALRAAGQSGQAAAVLEAAMDHYKDDADINIAYAKALTAQGRFDQALTVLDDTIVPQSPDWNALSVKGAILDQMGRNREARAIYQQALLIAPQEASLHANLGLSYAMTNDLGQAEMHLRQAAALPGSTPKIRLNLALVLGLQGRFTEAERIYAEVLPPEQAKTNMDYVRNLLTQQNRWSAIAGVQ